MAKRISKWNLSHAQHFIQNYFFAQWRLTQYVHPLSLIRVFALRLEMLLIICYLKSGMWRLWLDCADAQADICLRWAHIHFWRKCCAPASLIVISLILDSIRKAPNTTTVIKAIDKTSRIYLQEQWRHIQVWKRLFRFNKPISYSIDWCRKFIPRRHGTSNSDLLQLTATKLS